MAIAARDLLLPTISHSKISLSLFLFLWCATLACGANPSSPNNDPCELECQTTTVGGVDIVGNCQRKCPEGVMPPNPVDPFCKHMDNAFTSTHNFNSIETHPTEARNKRTKLEGEFTGKQLIDREWKDGEAIGDLSVDVGVEIMGMRVALKIKKIVPPSYQGEDEMERAKKMAQNAATLLLHGEMLQDMGDKLLAQSRAKIRSMFGTRPKSDHHDDCQCE
ncbi:hypothetical protein SESBI_32791 [Sesbania bispinosa]|nr:hypothetical protein SESBI_32791 [Sesbania bispinosa]